MTGLTLSIHQKISLGFYSILFLVTITALTNYGIALQVENKVSLVEVIDDFYNQTLECRRFEKNYFLYEKELDFQDNASYLESLHHVVGTHAERLETVIPANAVADIVSLIDEYQRGMQQLRQLIEANPDDSSGRHLLQDTVRQSGKQLTEFAENTAHAERNNIKNLLKTSRTILIFAVVTLIVVSLLLASLLGRKVIRSLRILEGYTRNIAEGERIAPPIGKAEKEIENLYKSFTQMNNECCSGSGNWYFPKSWRPWEPWWPVWPTS
jgi:nitrate/nitrite-specific signal transduction histidine kinase